MRTRLAIVDGGFDALHIVACCGIVAFYHGSMILPSFRASSPFVCSRLLVFVSCISLISSSAFALQVVPGSNCTAACTEPFTRTQTTGSDITCYDQNYNTTVAGNAFRDCVTCELESITFDHRTNQTDLGWALCSYPLRTVGHVVPGKSLLRHHNPDNLRYAASWCIFDYPRSQFQQVSTPCNQTCGSIATALETNLVTPNKSQPYEYCRDPRFAYGAASCASCYSQVPNQKLMASCKAPHFLQ